MTETSDAQRASLEEEVLTLRLQGRSFAGIAKSLGLERPFQANEAFNRALRRRPAREQDGIRQQELVRLSALAESVRSNRQLAPADVARRLHTLDRLRAMLVAV